MYPNVVQLFPMFPNVSQSCPMLPVISTMTLTPSSKTADTLLMEEKQANTYFGKRNKYWIFRLSSNLVWKVGKMLGEGQESASGSLILAKLGRPARPRRFTNSYRLWGQEMVQKRTRNGPKMDKKCTRNGPSTKKKIINCCDEKQEWKIIE